MPASTLVIKVTAGKDEPERSGQALNVAATALASGVAVSLWLTGEAAWFALPGRAAEVMLDHSPPLGDLLASVLAGGTVTLHSVCRPPRHHRAGPHRGRAHRRCGNLRPGSDRRRHPSTRVLSSRSATGTAWLNVCC